MELQHVNVKVFVEGELAVDLDRAVEVFHRLVAEQAMDEMMIDVADYRHVPAGPGVVMVGLEADYALDHKDDRWGLRYNRKAPAEGTNQERFRQAFAAAGKTCRLLEAELADLKFSRTDFELFINDRALAPHTDETLADFRGEIETFLRDDLGQDGFEIALSDDPRRLVGAIVRLTQPVEVAGAAK